MIFYLIAHDPIIFNEFVNSLKWLLEIKYIPKALNPFIWIHFVISWGVKNYPNTCTTLYVIFILCSDIYILIQTNIFSIDNFVVQV